MLNASVLLQMKAKIAHTRMHGRGTNGELVQEKKKEGEKGEKHRVLARVGAAYFTYIVKVLKL